MSSSHGEPGHPNITLERVQEWDALARQARFRPRILAGLCNVSLRTLERHFQKQYGLKVGKWLRDVRMKDAYERVQRGTSVKLVAFDLGYKQLSHFSRDFKKHFGVSPSLLLPCAKRKAGLRLESPSCPQIVFAF